MCMNSGSSVSIFITVPLVHPVHDTRSIVIPWDCSICLAIHDVHICRVTCLSYPAAYLEKVMNILIIFMIFGSLAS